MKTLFLSKTSVWSWLLAVILGFLSGSMLYSKHIPRLFLHKNICENAPDQNPGASNVFSSCGIGWGLLCLALDMFKAYLPVRLAMQTLDMNSFWFAAVMAAPVAGHAIGIFDGFHGGKCIAASFGVMLALLDKTPIGLLLAALYIFFSTIRKITPNRRRSIVTFTLFGMLSFAILLYQGKASLALGTQAISGIAVSRHVHAPDTAKNEISAQTSRRNNRENKTETAGGSYQERRTDRTNRTDFHRA